MKKYELKFIAYTMGSSGSILINRKESSFIDAPKVKVVDTVGAGDSFTAILIAGILNGVCLKDTHKAATNVAAYVCTQNGATPKLPEHLLNQIEI